MAESNIRLKVEAAGAVAALNQTSAASRRVSKSVNVLGTALKALPFIGIAEAARRFFSGFAEADKATAAVKTLGVDADKLKAKLLGVSNELKGLVSQTQLTAAAYDVASAGFTNAADAAEILKAASLGAVGGLSDLNTVADATTSVLNAYGLSSDKAAGLVDKFIQTQNDGKIVVAQYASQIGRVAPIAAAAGVGIDELNAAISAVTATGVPVESTFAGLRQAIASVIKPTKEAEETSKLLGIEFSSAAIKAKGFGGFLEDLINKTGGSEVALTKLFGSVEAVATILPLANDNLVKFNSSLDNQKDSAGAAEKATEDLGGTVSAQVTSIVNNIGNVRTALDTVLGPALKSILQDLNNIISAASTAISKFTDLATGAVSRSAAALQAAASTGFSSKDAFIALKESIGTLRPELAQSEQDLTNLQGALDEAGRAAGRFSGKGDFGKLRNEVFDTITAMRQLIINRREALKGANEQQGGGENVVDPELLALRERIRQLLDQQSKSGSGTGSAGQAEAQLKRQMEAAQSLSTEFQRQIELTNELDDAKDRILQRDFEIADLNAKFPDLKDEEIEKLEELIHKLHDAKEGEIARTEAANNAAKAAKAARKAQEADPLFQMQQQFEELIKLENQVAAGATSIGTAFSNAFGAVVTGAKTGQEALADMLKSIASDFLAMAKKIIAKQLIMILYGTIMKALGVGGVTSGQGVNLGKNPNFFNQGPPPLPPIPHAEGGVVNKPTNALIGEGGEPEYVIPASKMRESMSRYSRGSRGGGVIPDNRGGSASEDGDVAVAAPIDVRYTVERINSVDYVTADQFQSGMQRAASQGAQRGEQNTLKRLQMSGSTRRRLGM